MPPPRGADSHLVRHRSPFATCAALLLLACAMPASAQSGGSPSAETYGVELGMNFWTPTPDIVIQAGTGSTPVDLIEVFDIEDKRFRELKATVKPGRKHKIRYHQLSIQYQQDAVVNQTFVFQGRTFAINAPASADFSWTLRRFGYEWDFVSGSHGFAGVFGDLKYNKVEATLSSPLIGTETTDVTAPV